MEFVETNHPASVPFFALCLFAGIRPCLRTGEILRIKPEHVKLAEGVIRIDGEVSKVRDHPTNGLALCKNHHWALDQRLIAPDLTRVWRVSRHVEPRRSRGEDELARLAGQPLLAPVESAFAPDRLGLEWRFERLLS
jgi:putative restriction endonuclease